MLTQHPEDGKQIGRALTAVLTGTAVALAGLSGRASAAPPERGTFQDTFQVVVPDFCSPGLTVLIDGTLDVRFLEMARGENRLPYFMQHQQSKQVFTDQATGDYVREVQRVMPRTSR